MGAAIVFLFFLPWLDRCPVRSIRYRGLAFKIALAVFVVSFIGLGILGGKPVTPSNTIWARVFSLGYFAFFVLMPYYSRHEVTKPLPERVRAPILPLDEREGWFWQTLAKIWNQIHSSECYRASCTRLQKAWGDLESYLRLVGHKLWTQCNYRLATCAIYQTFMARIMTAIERLKNIQGGKQ
jgi:ubiquinol-cytochrome c reductase cytochrome b subunit